LLALLSEVRGLWVTLHDKPIWSLIHVPDFNNLETSIIEKAVMLFRDIGKTNVKTFYQRIKENDGIQRKIDEISMKMLGVDFDLDKIYNAIIAEIEVLKEIMRRTSRSRSRGSRSEESESCQVTLDEL